MPVVRTQYYPYHNLKEYMDHLYDVLYIETIDGTIVKHTQHTGADRVEAIASARMEIGPHAYIISVIKHAQDMNPEDMEAL